MQTSSAYPSSRGALSDEQALPKKTRRMLYRFSLDLSLHMFFFSRLRSSCPRPIYNTANTPQRHHDAGVDKEWALSNSYKLTTRVVCGRFDSRSVPRRMRQRNLASSRILAAPSRPDLQDAESWLDNAGAIDPHRPDLPDETFPIPREKAKIGNRSGGRLGSSPARRRGRQGSVS